MTNDEVPETITTRSTADMSHICEFGWYYWVMFRDNVPTFLVVKLTLGQYLGPAKGVGSALTTKILKSNGQTVCRSTLRHLNDKEINCPIHQEMQVLLTTLNPLLVFPRKVLTYRSLSMLA
jgi:hypothetical protein